MHNDKLYPTGIGIRANMTLTYRAPSSVTQNSISIRTKIGRDRSLIPVKKLKAAGDC